MPIIKANNLSMHYETHGSGEPMVFIAGFSCDQFDSSSWAQQINVPVMVMSGDMDLILPEPLTKALAAAIPRAQYYCFKNCGHLPYIEYPQQFCDLVRSFVRQAASKVDK